MFIKKAQLTTRQLRSFHLKISVANEVRGGFEPP